MPIGAVWSGLQCADPNTFRPMTSVTFRKMGPCARFPEAARRGDGGRHPADFGRCIAVAVVSCVMLRLGPLFSSAWRRTRRQLPFTNGQNACFIVAFHHHAPSKSWLAIIMRDMHSITAYYIGLLF